MLGFGWKRNMLRTLIAALLGLTAAAQTQIDLPTQAKRVDFTGATSTKPMKTGVALPTTCATGDMFFNTAAAAGSNLYACTATNTWTPQGRGSLSVASNGVTVGSRPAANFITGPGLVNAITDTGTQINVQIGLDTSVVETLPLSQSGTALLCASASHSTTSYQCSLTPTSTGYTTGMVLRWVPDVTATGGAITLNVDTLGAAPVKLADGVSNPTPGDLVAGRLYHAWYDGTRFRLMPTTAGSINALPDPGVNSIPYRSGPGAATAATADSLSGPFSCQDAGSTSAYACSLNPAIGGYTPGTTYWFKANTANNGPATVNFNGLGAKTIKKQSNQDLAANDIKTGQWVMATYDGTNMQMQSQIANAPSGGGAISTVFGRTGTVTAMAGDYSANQITGLAPSATTDTTNAGNIAGGTLNFSRLPVGLSVLTTQGDLLYGGSSGALTRLAGDTSNTRKFLRAQSSGGVAAAPAWDTLQSSDIPNNAANTTGTAANVTGINAEANGGTGAANTTGAAGHVLRSNGAHYVDSAIQAGDVPTLNQSTTGTAANVTGVVAPANGGLGANNTVGPAGHVPRSNGTVYVDGPIQASDVQGLPTGSSYSAMSSFSSGATTAVVTYGVTLSNAQLVTDACYIGTAASNTPLTLTSAAFTSTQATFNFGSANGSGWCVVTWSGATRTWPYFFTSGCQGAISGSSIELPNVYGVTLNPCGAATTEAEWSIAAGATCPTLTTTGCQWWWATIPQLPVANPSLTAYLQFRSVDTGHSVVLQVAYSCMTVGSVPDAPSYTPLTTATLTPSATSNALAQTSLSLGTVTCPAGDDIRIQFYPTTNTLTSPLALSRSNIVLLGGTY